MALQIFGTDPAAQPKPREANFADDIVGRFRSGHQVDGRPAALSAWRVTTGDPVVAQRVHELLGGDEPQPWEARGEDDLETFTAAEAVDIIIESPKALRQRMILWGRNNKPLMVSDGATIEFPEEQAGEPDPDAHLTFQERKAKARDGFGAEPSIELTFRLADDPDLGLFRFQSGSWSLASDLAYDGTDGKLEAAEGPARARLSLEEVSFTAKSGPRKGQVVRYTKPVIKVLGPVVQAAA